LARSLEPPGANVIIEHVTEERIVRAGGGLVWRRANPPDSAIEDAVEVLVVRRPAYADWSLPKGKAEAGESDAECALREVEEETAVVARLGEHAGSVEYRDRNGRPKIVQYWRMTVVADPGPHPPNDEIDDVRWLTIRQALEQLTYEHDCALVRDLRDDLAKPVEVFVVRHAKAGSRSNQGDDHLRKLTSNGTAQAEGLATSLADRGIRRIVSSSYVRCIETVGPLAHRLEIDVESSTALAEGAAFADAMLQIEDATTATLLCSHGDVIGDVLGACYQRGIELHADRVEKGSTWVLTVDGGEIRRAEYLPPPT
jgi:8-oxo-(d)GTP phosphatase